MAIIYFYLLLAVIHVIKNKRKLERKEFIPIAIFSFFPMAGGLVQGFFYGTLLMWSGSAFALILIYIFLQERMIHVDHSTGVWNNRSFYYYLNRLVKQGGIDKIGVIYIDLECPDEIAGERDRKERENALQAFAEEIKKRGEKRGRHGPSRRKQVWNNHQLRRRTGRVYEK
jgi:GGDEF domain-containing protein